MPFLPFLQHPVPRIPSQNVPPPVAAVPTNQGGRVGVLGASLHPQKPAYVVSSEPQQAAPQYPDLSERDRLVQYCKDAGVPIDGRWAVPKIKDAIVKHGPK